MQYFKRIAYIIMFLPLLTACKNLKQMLPEGPAFSSQDLTEWQKEAPHDVNYTDTAYVDFPVAAVQAWAATYDLDIILVSQHPDWNMHEFARLATPQGPVWIMKDAKEGSLDQYVVADLDNIQAWLPELPVARKAYPVKVIDHSSAHQLQLSFEYENYFGEKIKATYKGKYPKTALKKKNGSTMGHSKSQLLVGLDLPYRDFGKKAQISYDGIDYKMHKILGLVPFQMALKQTQGGLSSGQFSYEKIDGQAHSSQIKTGGIIQQVWQSMVRKGGASIEQVNDFRKISYGFDSNGGLASASVQQWNKTNKGVLVQFYPALPNLSRPFDGRFTSKFAMDIGGENQNAYGKATAYWEKGEAVLEITPLQPWWVVDRPMQTRISYQKGKATLSIKMIDK